MYFQQIEAYRTAGELGLKCFGLEQDYQLDLLHCSENATFLVSHKKSGRKYAAMRVGRPGYRTMEETKAEIRWLDQIVRENTVPIAKPIRCLDGRAVAQVKVNGREYHIVLCEYLEGEAPDPEDGDRGFPWFEKIGELAARLHLQTMNWEDGWKLDRPVWDYEALLGEEGLFGDWRVCEELGEKEYGLLEEVCERIKWKLTEYGKNERNFGLIHTDLRAANLLIDGKTLKVLDFDDCGYGWHLFDLAASVSFVETHPNVPLWMKAWLDGYTKIIELEEMDFDMIPTFLMTRRIQLLAWITSHDDSDPVKVYYQGFADGTIQLAKEYLCRGK